MTLDNDMARGLTVCLCVRARARRAAEVKGPRECKQEIALTYENEVTLFCRSCVTAASGFLSYLAEL